MRNAETTLCTSRRWQKRLVAERPTPAEIKQAILEYVEREIDRKMTLGLVDGDALGMVFHLYKVSGSPAARNSPEYRAWRTAVFERDDYVCQDCKQRGGKLQADHILGWAEYPEVRFDVDNGRTLCVECHAKRHPKHANLIRKAKYFKGPGRDG